MSDDRDRIAVVGLSGRFPGAKDISEFWDLLETGSEGIRFFDRESLVAAGVPPSLIENEAYVPANGYLDDIESFDATFFGMSPREAEITDPQHRLFLQCAWNALEDAGHVPGTFDGRIGVYAGCGLSTYLLFNLFRNPNISYSVNHLQFLMGNSGDYLPTRVSYKLNLTGPSVSVNTACSSSLVAIHMACQSLLEYESDVALAGGAGIQLPQIQGYLYEENTIQSPDGHCRAFDAEAAGTVSGNGLGVVVLRRLEDALSDGDNIRAVILGSAINNDGADKVGYTAPSVAGQASVIAEALSVAGVEPNTIQYVEAHGTGTPVGDPIEIEALTRAFGPSSDKYCALGSVKTNVGHLDEAAGVAGLIKTVLALENGQIPPTLHYQSPNPEIDFETGPFFVNDRLRPWPATATPRRAGVSSFGIGGTNAHLVLEQAPSHLTADESRSVLILPVSAKSPQALDRAKAQLADHLASNTDQCLSTVAQTLQIGRTAFEHRAFACGQTRDDLIRELRSADNHVSRIPQDRSITFMFPGQGAQYAGMASELYGSDPLFREELDRCFSYFDDTHAAASFLSPDLTGEAVSQTDVAQPAIFSVSYALARLWIHRGVKPDFLIGHSLGEYVAACLSGVFSLENAIRIVSERGKLMQSMPGGAMLAVAASQQEIEAMSLDRVDLAAVNAPELCVVSGPVPVIDDLEGQLSEQGVAGRRLATSHAFHSRNFDPILQGFEDFVGGFSLAPPQVPVISNRTGQPLTPDQATDPSYWSRHLREPVLFSKGVEYLLGQATGIFVEVGPGNTLTKLVSRSAGDAVVAASLPHPKEEQTDLETLARTTGRLWAAGVDLDWEACNKTERIQRTSLPGYPFEPERHWVEATDQPQPPDRTTVSGRANLDGWFYGPSWHQDAHTESASNFHPKRCLVFHDGDDIWDCLKDALESKGVTVHDAQPGKRYEQIGATSFRIRPGEPVDYGAMSESLGGKPPDCVVHLWGLSNSSSGDDADRGFHSLHALCQTLAPKYAPEEGHWLAFSRASLEVTGTESLAPEGASLSGLSSVISLEYPSLSCRHIDLDTTQPDLVSQIVHEIRTADGSNQSVWRDGVRWLRSWKALDLSMESSPILSGATYLITGGTGSMGMAIAEHLAEQTNCHLVLTGRSDLPDPQDWPSIGKSQQPESERTRRILQRIEAIERKGTTVEYVRADVSHPDSTENLRRRIEAGPGKLDGIIHTAGELDPGLLGRKSRQSVERVLGPKMGARRQLDTLLSAFQPSFLVLCSSMSSITPIVGQGDYAAGNAFIDAYAFEANRSYTTRVVSITWGFWQELGIIDKVRGDQAQKDRIEAEIREKGLHKAGIDAFARILSSPTPPQVVVTPDGLECRPEHPWFDRIVSVTEDVTYLEGTISTSLNWALADHVILGHHILPGTAYLEMARAAISEVVGDKPIELRDVVFLQPLTVEETQATDVRAVLRKQRTGWDFKVLSRNGDAWVEHARGSIEKLKPSDVSRMDLDEIREACQTGTNERLSASGRATFEASLTEFGEHWHNFESLSIGSSQAIGEFRLAPRFAKEVTHLHLHPSLLDNATGFLSIAFEQEALPFSYETIRIHGPLPSHIFSQVRVRDQNDDSSASYDVTISDASGRVILEIENYVLRRVSPETTGRPHDSHPNACLSLGEPGSLSTFFMAGQPRRTPGPQEVEVEVKAVGLNFLEVLYSLGMLPYEGDNFPYGLECAGIVRAVGRDVTNCQTGDEVIAYANGSYKAFTTVPATSIVRMPESLSMAEAATLPAAYLTAWYGLAHAGRLREGERVLIHSAAGGVGLASVYVARLLGANIFATAGTVEKRDYLTSLGVECVADSRNPGFGEVVLSATAGHGVDVVLNSLGESFTEESLSVLARYGRFVELGKRAILADGTLPLRHFERQLTYSAVDVGPDMPGFSSYLEEIVDHVRSGALPPLPHRSFAASNPAEGFEYMAQGKHIGKIVFTADSPSELIDQAQERPSATRSFDEIVGLAQRREPEDATDSSDEDVEGSSLHMEVITETERKIALIWHDLLGTVNVKRTDDFFDLNGDSLLAAQVISHIHRDLGVKLPFSAIFDAPTVEALGRVVDSSQSADETSTDEIEEGVI